ncbi:heterokaryon incompatibility protein [Diplodia corticola]|uniref:Heterokaryon incompatibility protein n=1 Tax=Diplodia corticola TaxID=236234 RepID=A0A1J9RZM6_9PEZI|nr:heterokaryon incompatibility protein [Diplodia corticola]OJD33799.1 heterokaryon incompatibility protein [Diplodia corticola]
MTSGDFEKAKHLPLGKSTGSRKTFDQIMTWLKKCVSAHDCGAVRLKDPHFLPSRLVCVERPVRIVERTEVDPGDVYLTLSHCWGEANHLTLTTDNFEEFKTALPMQRLPATFSDAITLTQVLGKRYIWIDSLCIIQNCTEDWETEANTMWEVYSNSYLNISATSAKNSSEGLFREGRSVFPSHATVLPGHPIIPEGMYTWYCEHDWDDEVENGSVNRRAWVLQERCLSPRVVHFCSEQVFWECNILSSSEAFPEHLPLDFKCTSKPPALYRLTNVETKDPAHLANLWNKIVASYTGSKLTNASDKLVAIAALARKVSEAYGDTAGRYCAGFWKDIIIRHLCWSPASGSTVRATGEDHRAPSWSWASVDGPVSLPVDWEFSMNRYMAIITDVVIHQENDYAPRIEGELHCSGPLLTASLLEYGGGFCSLRLSGAGHELEFAARMDGGSNRKNGFPFEVYLMPVEATLQFISEVSTKGLILAPTSDGLHHFERIGNILGPLREPSALDFFTILGNQDEIQSACVRKSGTLNLEETFARVDIWESDEDYNELLSQLEPFNCNIYDFTIV